MRKNNKKHSPLKAITTDSVARLDSLIHCFNVASNNSNGDDFDVMINLYQLTQVTAAIICEQLKEGVLKNAVK